MAISMFCLENWGNGLLVYSLLAMEFSEQERTISSHVTILDSFQHQVDPAYLNKHLNSILHGTVLK